LGTNQGLPYYTVVPGVSTNDTLDGYFQWVRGVAGSSTYEQGLYVNDPDDGPGWFANSGNGCSAFVIPRGYQSVAYTNNISPFETGLEPSDPRLLRTPLAGSTRDLVVAFYAAPAQPIQITQGSRVPGQFSVTWTSQPGETYSVYKKTNLSDSWSLLTSGY